jgi:hypothetical protein
MTGTVPDPASTATERTRLAWRRTGLAGTAVTLLTARLAIRDGLSPSRLALGGLSLLAWVGILLLGRYRLGTVGRSGAPPGWVPAVTATCLAWFVVLGTVLVVLP